MRWLKLSIGFAVTAGFVWLLAREVDLDALGQAFAGLSVSTVLFALAFLAAGWALRIVRWWWMLRPLAPSLPLGVCAGPFLAGMAINNVAPLRAGDALRVLGFRRQLRGTDHGSGGNPRRRAYSGRGGADRIALSGSARPACRRLPARLRRGGGLPGGRRHRRARRSAAARARARPRLGAVGRTPYLRCLALDASRFQPRRFADRGPAPRTLRPRTLVLIGLSAVAWACEGGGLRDSGRSGPRRCRANGALVCPRGRHPCRRYPQCAGLCRDIRLVRRPRHPSLWRLDGSRHRLRADHSRRALGVVDRRGLFCLLAHSIRPMRAQGLPSVPARRKSSGPPTTDKLPAMPQASAAAIRAGTAGEVRCER